MNVMNYSSDEKAMLEALVRSPVFRVLKKIIEEDRSQVLAALATELDEKKIFRLQGRYEGTKVLENVPQILAKFAEVERQTEPKKKKNPQI